MQYPALLIMQSNPIGTGWNKSEHTLYNVLASYFFFEARPHPARDGHAGTLA